MKKLLSLLLLGGVLASPVFGEDWQAQPIGPFGTLNNFDNSLIIPAEKAQDALNVDVSPGGKSVKKREGYGLAYTLAITTSAVHGIYNFFESGGSDVSLFFADNRVQASVGGAALTVIHSTGPIGATWQCVDSQGFAYCANTSRSGVIKTAGTGFTFVPVISTGYIVAVTPERLVQAGFASTPNRVDFSKANDFSTWTTGSAATDPINFTITAPGSKITHVTYAFDRVMWFKDSSFGYILVGNQALFADWQIVTVSPNLGTNDNTSVYWNDVLYFRGQDGHIYGYDGSSVTKLTRDITTTTEGAQTRRANSWTQTTQSDFEAGSYLISGWQNTSSSSGQLQNKTSFYMLDTASEWSEGSFSSNFLIDTHTHTGALAMTFPDLFDSYRDGTAGTKPVWEKQYFFGTNPTLAVSGSSLTFTIPSGSTLSGIKTVGPLQNFSSGATYYLKFNINTGSSFNLCLTASDLGNGSSCQNESDAISMIVSDSGSNQVDYSVGDFLDAELIEITNSPNPGEISLFISPTRINIYDGFTSSGMSRATTPYNPYVYISGFDLRPKFSIDEFSVSPVTATWNTSSTSGRNFTDTGITGYAWDIIASSFTDSSNSIVFKSSTSATEVTPTVWVNVSTGHVPSLTQNRYIYQQVSFNYTDFDSHSAAVVGNLFYGAYSSGSFRSQIKNAPSLTAWDAFAGTKQDGSGSHVFYMRSSTNSFTVLSSTPSWTAVTLGGIPSISTGTYFQVRDDFLATNSSSPVVLSDFTVNWFEGSATDKSYATYFDNRILWSVASGAGATGNNYTLIFDLLNEGWLLYDIGANGFLVRDQNLYFGDPDGGYVYRFGETDSDNGTAINAYWKSKDFILGSPFIDKELVTLSVSAKSVASSSMTVTHTVNGSSSTAYTVNLYDAQSSFIRNNKNLPLGRVGHTVNVKFGNNAADQPFEVFGIQVGYRPKSWKPIP